MLLARGDVVIENTKVRFFDFDTLLVDDFESLLKKTEKITGYVSIAYHNRKDILIIFEGQIKEALTFFPNKTRQIITIDDVLGQAGEDSEGVLNYYKMPQAFVELLWDSFSAKPVHDKLSTSFVRWDNYLQTLQDKSFTGYLESENEGMLGYILMKEGLIEDEFYYQPLDLSKLCKFRLFNLPEPYFIPEKDEIKLNFLDIFSDMLKTTYSIFIQSDDHNVGLSKALSIARKKYPILLKEVHNKKSGSLDFEIMLKNLEEIPSSDKRDAFVDCLIELLYQRLMLIKEAFDEDIFERTLKELKMVQLYYQKPLRRFRIGESLLILWKKFD
ncbi:hypothetical protein ACFL27_10730 [candidate division CSSED10-310 bacterium]|uniref:Uncharacterized protein n=1 Tax=candidate division CSSED10-310 bacterium TaxID=2855610 RepID=A0ABV6YWS4_UNCC1